jgi:hypothetical protein
MRRKRFRHDIRRFRRQAWCLAVALLMVLVANSAFSKHISVRKTLSKVSELGVVIGIVPEPSTASLLALGGALLLWRRHKRKQAAFSNADLSTVSGDITRGSNPDHAAPERGSENQLGCP